MEAEVGTRLPQLRNAKGCWQPTEARKRQEDSSLEPSEGAWPHQFGLPASRPVREELSVGSCQSSLW